jgi:hypothetical protein
MKLTFNDAKTLRRPAVMRGHTTPLSRLIVIIW